MGAIKELSSSPRERCVSLVLSRALLSPRRSKTFVFSARDGDAERVDVVNSSASSVFSKSTSSIVSKICQNETNFSNAARHTPSRQEEKRGDGQLVTQVEQEDCDYGR